jgi:2-keto-3-deoxy-L-arabinonate dehydratase
VPPTVHGLVPVLATPFTSDGELDLRSLRGLTEFQLAHGADGVAVGGMASEAFALTADERLRVLREVVDVVGGALPVVSGVNATSTVTAVEQAREAVAGGADALMVLPPYMVKPSAAQVVDFYAEVGSAADVDVMVQDAPTSTGVTLPVSVLVELSKLDNVTSVKVEAAPTARKVGEVVDAVGDEEFAVLGGLNAQSCLAEYERGAIGTMPACEFTDELAVVLADWASGEKARARSGFQRLLPLILLGLQSGIAWAVHKEVLVRRGIIADATVRAPAAPLDPGDRAYLLAVLDDLGIPR